MSARLFYRRILLLCVVFAAGCAKKDNQAQAEAPASSAAASPRGPQIVQEMVAAHGGMQTWRSAPTVSFDDEFSIPGRPAQVSRVIVEQSRRRAYIDVPGAASSMAWNGEKAWSTNWQSPMPPRFLALLNYYFVDLPWLTQDPGVKLGEPSTAKLPGDATEYVTVMMTFEAGTGDTPDDYYRLYIDPATKHLKACAYVVTYKSLLPAGVASTPEHILVYDELAVVGGLLVPVHYTVYDGDAVYATCAIRNWAFDRQFDASRMTMPEGAAADTSAP